MTRGERLGIVLMIFGAVGILISTIDPQKGVQNVIISFTLMIVGASLLLRND